ncbi:uncharacterized protein LOC132197166 [Neocloeon triangulifer]|uniref:uncharacterized protein LOC132197166 n=1 Tax=Neocloeon triangulifer TaxID=2078957 RepID=UPI00286EF9DF|nr:uncharacterized protein LOC132197166 [Neocloeon triangulifer]
MACNVESKENSMMDSVNDVEDLHSLSQRLEEQFSFLHQHEACSVCSGYYGPCFGEPMCATCHAFLFPDDLGRAEAMPMWDSCKKDDGDSGNDEPSDPYYSSIERRCSAMAAQGPPAAPPDPSPSPPPPADAAIPPRPPQQPVDRLAERLELLSAPRDPEYMSPGFIDKLPPEVLLVVFNYLDDLSLCAVSNVCRRWRRLLEARVTNQQWKLYTENRWPLFTPLFDIENWSLAYKKLVASAPCQLCLQQMAAQCQPSGQENSWRRHRLRTEIKSMRQDPQEGIQAIPLDRGCCHWIASILGPQGSPYSGGIFYLYLQIPYSYPMHPPLVRFVTKIFHPNVSRHGDVGIDLIHHNWSLAMTVVKVLISVQSLLTDPFCQVCMEPKIGDLYLNDKKSFELMARNWTWKYAMHDAIIPSAD